MNFKKKYTFSKKDYFKFNLRTIKRQAIIYSIAVVLLAFVIRYYAVDLNSEVLKDLN